MWPSKPACDVQPPRLQRGGRRRRCRRVDLQGHERPFLSRRRREGAFFHSHRHGPLRRLSQFYFAQFRDREGRLFSCMEMFMMAAKAQSMCEPPSLAKILETPLAEAAHNPDRFKKIGPEITPYIEAVWVDEREQAVTQGNLLKFCQNAELRSVPLPCPRATASLWRRPRTTPSGASA